MTTEAQRKAPASNGGSGQGSERGTGRESGPEVSSRGQVSTTDRGRRDLARRAREYWTPPNLLTKPPPAYSALVNYAYRGAWTSKPAGPVREVGIFWHRAASLPVTAVCRYAEWIGQRPGRAIPVFIVWRLFIASGAGVWLTAHVIHPVLGFLAWALL